MQRKTILMLVLSLIFAAAGCGKGTKEEGDSETRFRVPDSLLAPIESYNLTRDDYDPVDGGVMANPQIELHYPAGDFQRPIAIKTFGIVRSGYLRILKQIGRPAKGRIVLIGAKNLDEYNVLTRKEWWYYGYIQGDTIYFEPYDILLRRNIADVAIAQKLAQAAIIKRSGGRTPLWMMESVASHVAGEGDILKLYGEGLSMRNVNIHPSPDVIERHLAEAVDRELTRAAFYAAYMMLENLFELAELNDVLGFMDKLAEGNSLDEASSEVFGMNYQSLIDRVRID